ncbi:MAG TPA: xanthine dehydrogenase family protein molybdopterin-binding subunit [candidate division Zixibacteria bacterium]|nr:xanthine dehydrogenase family protein molybdopterin-binding subunit [candidate division Zixibacteria bacterium]
MSAEAHQLSIVGTSIPRVDGIAKVTGRAKYAGDLALPGLVHGKFLRSPYAHARILLIDTRQAEAMPGVAAVVTAADFADVGAYVGKGKNKDQPLIACDRALFAGQPVAAVAAVDTATAEEAVARIRVEYEELPGVIDVDEALAEGAPLVHGFAERNICHQTSLVKGDVEKGFAESDAIFEDSFEFPMVYHYSMEPHTVIARVDDEGIHLWTSTGHPFGVRQEIAQIFRHPLSRVHVHVDFVGGAYGSKSGVKIEPLVVALARKAGCPVRVVQGVSEAMATCRRHAVKCRLKTGVKRDGTLLAKEAEIYLNTGAYAETGPIVTGRTLTRILGPYRYPHFKIRSYCVYTNTVSAASFRSIGGPQTAWATESQLDIIAQKLALDPLEIRLKNLVRRGEEIRPGYRPLDADLFKAIGLVAGRIGWNGPATRDGRGRGFGLGTTDPGAPLASTATVHVLSDGSVVLLCGTVELGQGARTVMSQIVAEELSVPPERVTVRPIDTAFTPFDRSTGSSRSTTVMGKAVQLAAVDARRQILELAAEYFEAPQDTVAVKDGEAKAGGRKVSYGELIHRHFAMQGGELVGRGYAHSGMASEPANPLFWEVGVGAAEVEVDRETGEVRVRKYVTAADAGKAIHPLQCEGQDEGAAMMGFGHTFYESYRFESGQVINSSMVDYRVPRFDDVPEEFHSILIEDGNGPGPYGAKGLGEGGIIPVAPAVANAVAWSTGARIKELPLTPEKVWRALNGRSAAPGGR